MTTLSIYRIPNINVINFIYTQASKITSQISKGREYNERLKAQSLKQATFNSKEFLSPEVYNEGTIKDIYYFDMKYIRGTTLSSSIKNLDSNEIELIANKIIALIKENRDSSETLNQSDSVLLVIKKLFSS